MTLQLETLRIQNQEELHALQTTMEETSNACMMNMIQRGIASEQLHIKHPYLVALKYRAMARLFMNKHLGMNLRDEKQ